jgi:hypothetical protein
MHGFWMFWIVALVFWSVTMRRRRQWWAWRRWEMMGPPSWWYGPDGAPGAPWSRGVRGARGAHDGAGPSAMPARRDAGDGDEASHVEALESRIAELEQRLDFTERLLAGRDRNAQASESAK